MPHHPHPPAGGGQSGPAGPDTQDFRPELGHHDGASSSGLIKWQGVGHARLLDDRIAQIHTMVNERLAALESMMARWASMSGQDVPDDAGSGGDAVPLPLPDGASTEVAFELGKQIGRRMEQRDRGRAAHDRRNWRQYVDDIRES